MFLKFADLIAYLNENKFPVKCQSSMKSPRQQFLENKDDVRFLSDLMVNDKFLRALNYTLLQYIWTEARGANGNDAHGYQRIVGAQGFMDTLSKLWIIPKEPRSIETGNLDHLK